jgi:hypothetical protein
MMSVEKKNKSDFELNALSTAVVDGAIQRAVSMLHGAKILISKSFLPNMISYYGRISCLH